MPRLLFSTLIDKVRQLATVAFTPGCFTRETSPFRRQCGEIRPLSTDRREKGIYNRRPRERDGKIRGERCARNGAEERERDTRAPNDRGMNFIGAIRNEIEARRNYRDAFRGE